ncbi:MAG: Fur family transcriptional regulator [bacterium]|nr:Fur family transcriptional regulator [bacterium]
MMKEDSPRATRLRDAGYKLTNARLCVLEVLERHDGHMTSTQVLEEVARLNPSIGRASVFRTLDLFTQLALIRPTYIDSSMTPTYVLMPNGHHHHIVCVNCNRVIEFEDCGLGDLTRRLEQQYGVKMSGHLLEFYGQCTDCETVAAGDDVEA